MVKMTFASAALIAAIAFTSQAIFTSQAMTAGHRPTNSHTVAKDCVRAPNVGAFATDPWTVPPCMPNASAGAFH